MTLGVLQTLKVLPRRLPQGRVVPVARLLDRGVDPAVVVLVELGGARVGVGGPGHAHRAHHDTRGVHSNVPVIVMTRDVHSIAPGPGHITVSLSAQYPHSHGHHHHNVTSGVSPAHH